MYGIRKTGQFKKDVKLCSKRQYDLSLLLKAMQLLETDGALPPIYHPHKLTGKFDGETTWDGHILPDWVLLWQIKGSDAEDEEGTVVLLRTGTHSDLFR
jgi:mRNA interferase YafQ